ncbi:MAG: cytochrome P450 [Gammaproteobacteria bacterium]|nr:cytochrome P450 [Gammaproteobacteria bacterium]
MNKLPDSNNSEYANNLYHIYKDFRENSPVLEQHSLNGTSYSLFKYHDIKPALKDARLGASATSKRLLFSLIRKGNLKLAYLIRASNVILNTDDPRHSVIRSVLNKPLRRYPKEQLIEDISTTANFLLDNCSQLKSVDLIKDFAEPLSFMVIAKIIGLPVTDHAKMARWAKHFGTLLDASQMTGGLGSIKQLVAEFQTYINPIVKKRRDNPCDDIISSLALARYDSKTISDIELLANSLFFVAGNISTAHLIGNCTNALISHPSQFDCVKQKPELISSAIEETLRYESPFQVTARVAKEKIMIGETIIPKGSNIRMLLGSANHDPEQFKSPDEFNIMREDNVYLSFGGGIHACLGKHLAKLESSIAINLLFQRFPDISLTNTSTNWLPGHMLRGMDSLPVKLH